MPTALLRMFHFIKIALPCFRVSAALISKLASHPGDVRQADRSNQQCEMGVVRSPDVGASDAETNENMHTCGAHRSYERRVPHSLGLFPPHHEQAHGGFNSAPETKPHFPSIPGAERQAVDRLNLPRSAPPRRELVVFSWHRKPKLSKRNNELRVFKAIE
jgi:hypothetical protein